MAEIGCGVKGETGAAVDGTIGAVGPTGAGVERIGCGVKGETGATGLAVEEIGAGVAGAGVTVEGVTGAAVTGAGATGAGVTGAGVGPGVEATVGAGVGAVVDTATGAFVMARFGKALNPHRQDAIGSG